MECKGAACHSALSREEGDRLAKDTDYRSEIDGLRALAVVPVVLFHAGISSFVGGFVGVDVFFVISGYLITRQILTDLNGGRFSLIEFYERRARRILPALFLVVVACIPFAWVWMLPSQMARFGDSMGAVAGFASNILFWRQDGYFDEAAEFKPLLHTWSLAVEEQFYILFPLFLLALHKAGKRAVTPTILVFALASYLLCLWGSKTMPVATFYLAPTRAWELLAGSLCALRPIKPPGRADDLWAFAGLAAIAWSVTNIDGTQAYPGPQTAVPVLGTVLVILFARRGTLAARFLSWPLFVAVGLISYSVYLWHQPLFVFARLASPGVPSLPVMLVLAATSFALGYATWRLVEQPFRRRDDRWFAPRRGLFMFSGLGLISMAGIGLFISGNDGFVSWGGKKPLAYLEYSGKDLAFRACDAPELQAARLTYCRMPTFGEPNAAIVGDSHAEDKFYGLGNRDHARRWMLLASSSCPPVLNIDVVTDDLACKTKAGAAFDYIVRQRSIQTVALSFLGSYPLTKAYAFDHLESRFGPERMRISSTRYPDLRRDELFARGLRDAVEKLVNAQKDVIIFVDQPELPFLPLDCIKGANGCSVPVSQALSRQALHRRILADIQKEFPSVRLFDPMNTLCTRAGCSYRKGAAVLYRDSHHLSLVGSNRVADQFVAWDERTRKSARAERD